MSASLKTTLPSSKLNFISIFESASKEYKRITREDLDAHPFAAVLDNCDSPDAISRVFRKQAHVFDEFRKGDERLMQWLNPTIHILFTFSATLGEGIGLPFSPGKAIFSGIGILLAAAKDVVTSHDTLVSLFERIQGFLERLKIYIDIPLTPQFTEVLGKVMAQVLLILAISTKTMTQRRIKKYLKRLVGRTDVEDAMNRLDMLTQEETRMAVAKNLEVTHSVDGNVKAIKEITHDVDGNLKAIKKVTHDVDRNVKVINEVVCDVGNDTKAIKEATYSVSDDVKMIKKETEQLTRNQSTEKLRAWLSPPNPSINHNVARDTRHDGTATWFIQGRTFNEWKANGSMLWIRGNPGSGKSILCSTIIEDIEGLQASGKALMAYYYFDFKDMAKRDVRGLLSSLLIQLCDYSEDCWSVLSRLYALHRDGSNQPNEATLAHCLRDMLELPGQLKVYLIMDALDECPNTTGFPSPREKVLGLVEGLVKQQHPNLYVCVTSRPEQDIRAVLESLTLPQFLVSLHEETGQREDIVGFVESVVYSDRTMRRWRAGDKELVINTLSEKAGGMFRWVFCQLDTLRRCIPASIKCALNELPVTLDETYERTLEGIPEEKWQHAHRLFQCLIASVRPLKVEELAEIFAIQFDSQTAPKLEEGWRPEDAEEAVLSACSSLISVIDVEGSQVVQFSHFSVKEFLTSDRLANRRVGSILRYYIPLEPAHMLLAQACLTTLLQLDEDIHKDRLRKFPLAFYAAQYWVEHAKSENISPQIRYDIEQLFDATKPHFRAWIWIYDIDRGKELSAKDLNERSLEPGAGPLYYAALCGLRGLAEHLISISPQDIHLKGGQRGTPLHAASYCGHAKLIHLLIAHGVDANVQSESRWTPLHDASSMGHLEAVDLLLQHNADLNAKDGSSWTPLHFAAAGGHLKVVQLLLERGADIHALTSLKSTPLHLASIEGMLDVARLLLARGADVNAGHQDSWSPFRVASINDRHEVMQFLLEHGAEEQ